MKLLQQFSEPEHVVDRQPYRIRIDGKDGSAIEIVEQLTGGFCIIAVRNMGEQLVVKPLGHNKIIIEIK